MKDLVVIFNLKLSFLVFLHCFDNVGCAIGRAFGLYKNLHPECSPIKEAGLAKTD